MVTHQVRNSFGFFKTTAIGGIFFLLPIVVIAVLLGQLAQIVWMVGEAIAQYLPADTPFGYSLLFLAALFLIVLACFAAGVAARRSLAAKFTGTIEKYLVMIFPRYAIFKEQLSGNIGGKQFSNRLVPVLVNHNSFQRLAFQVETLATGHVTIFLPGSPDPWNGTVVLVNPADVQAINIGFADAVGVLEKLGQDMQLILARSGVPAQPTSAKQANAE
jgi:uncharacterized membrane protein